MATSVPATSKPKRRPWWIWVLLSIVSVSAIGWFIGPSMTRSVKNGLARHYAKEASAHMEKENWPGAVQDIALARRWDPEAPEVLRVVADFLIKVRGDVFSLHHVLLRLLDAGQATVADRLRIAQFQLSQGDVARARTTLEALPKAEFQQRQAQELLANILRVEGRAVESEQVMRQALMAAGDDPVCRMRLALLDYQTPFPEVRARARERIWEIAAGGDEAAAQAIQFLSGETSLTATQADRLLQLVEQHPPKSPAVRLHVLSAVMRLRPGSRAEILAAELAKYDSETGKESPTLLQWLIDEHEYDQVLRLLPADLGKSATLLDFNLKALGGSNRWADVDKLLAKQKEFSVPAEVASLWHARAAHHLYHEPARTQQHLLIAFEAAGRGQKGEVTLEAARFAEECGLWSVAAICYKGIAHAHPTAQIKMLEKVHEMALRQRDTTAVLQSARFLAEQSPANKNFATRLLYFQLITGEDMEIAINQVQKVSPSIQNGAGENLVQALSAYRLGDLQTMKT
ncbi:MAG: hypothetical protein U0984_15545, partial [Prosthecobacter sp.]|nr:hypothetical protein [Prosthecobacter sp.]